MGKKKVGVEDSWWRSKGERGDGEEEVNTYGKRGTGVEGDRG